MRRIIFSFTLLFTTLGYAQIKFEKGYIITKNDDIKKEVLIKNIDWTNSPSEFIYKTDDKSIDLKGNPSNIKEFGVYGFSKYISYTGFVDASSSDLSKLSYQFEPENKNVTAFLKEIVSGDKKLYSYQAPQNSNIYFYSDSEASEIKPLIYKRYHPDGNQLLVAINDGYIQQLRIIFDSDSKAKSLISQTKYSTNSLTKIFKTHNVQISGNNIEETLDKKNKSVKFNLQIRPGINYYSPLKTTNIIGNNEFPSTVSFRMGIEAEIVLPINKNKWAVIFEPSYSFYTNKKITAHTENNLYDMSMDKFSFVNLPIGVRHYMYLNEKSKFFLNGQINILQFKTGKAKSIDLDYEGYIFDQVDLSSNNSLKGFSFGAGYNYNNKYTVELRYNTSGEMLKNADTRSASLQYFSVILGYNIF